MENELILRDLQGQYVKVMHTDGLPRYGVLRKVSNDFIELEFDSGHPYIINKMQIDSIRPHRRQQLTPNKASNQNSGFGITKIA